VPVKRLRLGSTGLGLFGAPTQNRPRIPHHTFAIQGPKDAQEFIAQLRAKGAKVDDYVRPYEDGAGYSVYVDDPAGNHLELSVTPS